MLSCAVIAAFSCASPERFVTYSSREQQKESILQYQNTPDTNDKSGVRFRGGDGSSMENAIIIDGAKNEIEAVAAEIGHISGKHGEKDRSWKMIMQSNLKKNDRIYVEYQIEDFKTGVKTAYFFDNTSLYSAFLEDTGAPATPAPKPVQKDTLPAYQPAPAAEVTEISGVRFRGGDGSSMENAIIIYGAKNGKEAARAEMDYISTRHGVKDRFWKIMVQSNFRKNLRHYNDINIKELNSGERFGYCFDVTEVPGY